MSALAVHKFTVAEYKRMIQIGVLTTDDRVELLRGEIVAKMSQNNPHARAIDRLNRILGRLLAEDIGFRCQCPLELADSMPEPDFSVFFPDDGVHPTAANLQVAIEVSDDSLRIDRGLKLELYAEAKVPVYWVVNIPGRCVEVFTGPQMPAGGPANYLRVVTYSPADAVPVEVAGVVVGSVPVAAILG